MESFYYDNKDNLSSIFLPKYSPDMNPQENIWNHLKAKLFKPSARKSIYELASDIKMIFHELNDNPYEINLYLILEIS
jgi:transposase